MKKIKSLLFGTAGLLGAVTASATDLVWYESSGSVFKVQAPAGWKLTNSSKYFQVAKPDGSVVLTISAWGKDGGSIEEFSNYRFSSVETFYKEQTGTTKISGGFAKEYEGVWPGETTPTYYVVSAVEKENAYFSLNLVTNRTDFEKNKSIYYKMFESVSMAHNNKQDQ